MPAKPKPQGDNKKAVLQQLEDICRRIVFWRDGLICVEQERDGSHCGGGIQWGHFIPRKKSAFLKYNLSNTFCQCASHNFLHNKGTQTFAAWYGTKFGISALDAIDAAARLNVGHKIYVYDYREMLEQYIKLYENRPSVSDFETLVKMGYYGEIIRQYWRTNSNP